MDLPRKILDILQLAGKDRPFDRLERGKPVAGGKDAVAASELPILAQGCLYLYFDCFEEAHNVANDHEGSWQGNWIHAIVHRREPDAGNSRYWYARVSPPAGIYQAVGQEALRALGPKPPEGLEKLADKLKKSGTWVPEVFVEVCDRFRKEAPASAPFQKLAQLQEIEWQGLLQALLKERAS